MLVSKKSRTPSRNIESPSNDEDVEDAQEEELQNERLQQLEMELSAARCPPMASPLYDGDQQQATPSADGDVATQTEATTREVDQLLELFAVEPSEEAELAAKFTLFENFLANVTAIRTQTLEFWEENKDQFVGASGAACEREIKAIDSTDAMGIDDSALSKWFVHAMTKKANQNNAAITQTLAKLRSRLELLAGELGECPCCLDAMQAETCTTLGCCHKVCTDCWDHWVELKGAAAFCPLCKHREFVEEVLGGTFG